MNFQAVIDERDKHPTTSLAWKVLVIFTSQPNMIGRDASCLRRLNYADPKDYAIWKNAVDRDFQDLCNEFPGSKDAASKLYTQGMELLRNEHPSI